MQNELNFMEMHHLLQKCCSLIMFIAHFLPLNVLILLPTKIIHYVYWSIFIIENDLAADL